LTLTSTKAKSKSKKKRKGSSKDEPTTAQRWRQRLETTGLVVLLAAIVGAAYYFLQPESAESLFQKAEILMASQEPEDWATARSRYIAKLEERYPDHPYKKETRAWRDQVLLHEVQRRAKNIIRLKNPTNDNERDFENCNAEVTAAIEEGNTLRAAQAWRTFASHLEPDKSEDDRQWFLLADSSAKALLQEIKERTEQVTTLLNKAEILERQGESGEARRLLEQVIERFGKYKEIRKLLPAGIPGPRTPEPSETPATPEP
jgi:tetratricopeptide (TPR) repeat protein